jgi:rare lipoprotein A (peptidoglycan hydrolase)
MAGAPVLALMHVSAPPAASPVRVMNGELTVAAAAPAHRVDDPGSALDEPPPTEPTTVPPLTSTTAVTTAPTTPARRTTSTTSLRRTTTTARTAPKQSAAPAKPAPRSGSGSSGSGSGAAPAPSGNTQSGGATWYDAAPPGTCAHKTLPMGTVVTIRNNSTGATATCTVSDRGPYADGMIIDLAKDVFQKLAPLSQGVVQATITW